MIKHIITGNDLGSLKITKLKAISLDADSNRANKLNKSYILATDRCFEERKSVFDIEILKEPTNDDALASVVTTFTDGSITISDVNMGKTDAQIDVDIVSKPFVNLENANFVRNLSKTKTNLTFFPQKEGSIKVYNYNKKPKCIKEHKIDGNRSFVSECIDKSIVALGGEETDLSIVDQKTFKETFKARNLPHDFLSLRKPIWPTDACFMSPDTLVVCTGFTEMRVYDVRVQKRPTLNVDLKETVDNFRHFTCLQYCKESNCCFVADNCGTIGRLDLRKNFHTTAKYKECSASTSSLALKGNELMAAGLDRVIRVYDVKKKKLTKSVFVGQRVQRAKVLSELDDVLGDIETEDEESDIELDSASDNDFSVDESEESDLESLSNIKQNNKGYSSPEDSSDDEEMFDLEGL